MSGIIITVMVGNFLVRRNNKFDLRGNNMGEFFRYNPIQEFDLSVLDDNEFNEDGVREDIIAPLLKSLGYSVGGPNKLVRSRKLIHPYVAIGSKRKNINIIPDYVLEVGGTPAIIVEAKSPKESLDNSKHAEQAYSYAIHPDIRAQYYILCNGKRFVLYHVNKFKPLLDIKMRVLPHYWNDINLKLSPENVMASYTSKLKKDFGLHVKRLGFHVFENQHFVEVRVDAITRIEEDLFTIGTGVVFDEEYCVSFDFDMNALLTLEGKIPQEAFDELTKPFENRVEDMRFVDTYYTVSLRCHLSDKLVESRDEIFLPFIVDSFL